MSSADLPFKALQALSDGLQNPTVIKMRGRDPRSFVILGAGDAAQLLSDYIRLVKDNNHLRAEKRLIWDHVNATAEATQALVRPES